MSGVDQFLAQGYGNTEPSSEDVEKVAQAEMFLKLAASHGVDISQLNNEEVDQLWNTMWTEKAAADNTAVLAEQAQQEYASKVATVKEAQEKFAEADEMGRVMAHSYVANLRGIAEQGGLDFMKSAAAVTESGHKLDASRYGAISKAHHDLGKAEKEHEKESPLWNSISRPGMATAHRLRSRNADYAAKKHEKGHNALNPFGGLLTRSRHEEADDAKTSSAIDQFAAQYAVEKAAAAGFNAEEAAQRVSAVLVLGPGESDKIAYVDGLENAVDVRSSEFLELAGYPVDWSGTIFAKEAAHEVGSGAEKYPPHIGDSGGGSHPSGTADSYRNRERTPSNLAKHEKGVGVGARIGEAASNAGRKAVEAGHNAVRLAKAKPWHTGGAIAGGAALTAGAAYGAHKLLKKKDEPSEADKTSSINFDNLAAEYAVKHAEAAGWDAAEAGERINSLFNLGYEGDPMESQKVASAQNDEQALSFRGFELLELAGYTINW